MSQTLSTGLPTAIPQIPPNPFGPPPPDGNATRGPSLNAVTWVLAGISIVFFGLRVYTRRFMSKNLGVEDAILAISLALLLLESAEVSVMISYGFARHAYYVGIQGLSEVLKWQAIANTSIFITPVLPKIVVTMLIINIMRPSKYSIWGLWVLNGFNVVMSFVCMVLIWTECKPASAAWTKKGTCWDPNITLYTTIAQSALAGFTDVVLAIFPMPTIWKLQLSLQKRIGVCILMGLGILAAVAAFVKTYQLAVWKFGADPTWRLYSLTVWVVVEVNVVYICACVPVLRPLWRKALGRPTTTGASYGYGGNSNNSRMRTYNSGRVKLQSEDKQRESPDDHDGGSSRKSLWNGDYELQNKNGIMVTRDIDMA